MLPCNEHCRAHLPIFFVPFAILSPLLTFLVDLCPSPQSEIVNESKDTNDCQIKMMNNPSEIYTFSIFRCCFTGCTIQQRAVDQLVKGIDMRRQPLDNTSAQDFIVEGKIHVVHHHLKQFGHLLRITSKEILRHCRD